MDTITTIQSLLKFNGSAQFVTVSLTQDDSRLIAAAPSLLEACKGVLALFDSLTIVPNGDSENPNGDPAYIAAFGEFFKLRAIIAKAEGAL